MEKRVVILSMIIVVITLVICIIIFVSTDNPVKDYLKGELATAKQDMSITVVDNTIPPEEPPDGPGGPGGPGGPKDNRTINRTIPDDGNQFCNESWKCENWSVCVNNSQSRNCTDTNNCNFENTKTETKPCSSQELPKPDNKWPARLLGLLIIAIVILLIIIVLIVIYRLIKEYRKRIQH